MRLDGLKSLLFLVIAIFLAGTVASCDNPFDPLEQSDKIQGLTYFDFSASQEHWDSDPEWDGLAIEMSYYNEFGDQLNFHDKPHKITVEFWSEVTSTDTTSTIPMRGSFITAVNVNYSNSDDVIRIPIEYYYGALQPNPVTTTTTTNVKLVQGYSQPVTGILQVRVFPPQESPQKELVFLMSGVEFYTPEDVQETTLTQ